MARLAPVLEPVFTQSLSIYLLQMAGDEVQSASKKREEEEDGMG